MRLGRDENQQVSSRPSHRGARSARPGGAEPGPMRRVACDATGVNALRLARRVWVLAYRRAKRRRSSNGYGEDDTERVALNRPTQSSQGDRHAKTIRALQ